MYCQRTVIAAHKAQTDNAAVAVAAAYRRPSRLSHRSLTALQTDTASWLLSLNCTYLLYNVQHAVQQAVYNNQFYNRFAENHKPTTNPQHLVDVLVVYGDLILQRLGRWTCDREVVGSTPGRVAIKWFVPRKVTVCGQVNHLGITNTKVNSAFHPSGVDKSSTSLHGWG